MDAKSVEGALSRIEAAIARIERASARQSAAAPAAQERHERLRAAVAQSLRQLDELLEGQG